MAAPWNPPKRAEDFEGSVALADMAVAGSFKANPTLASGDVKISKDDGAFANLATLPSVAPASGVAVKFALTGTEMTADKVVITFIDQTSPKEWGDLVITILTTA